MLFVNRVGCVPSPFMIQISACSRKSWRGSPTSVTSLVNAIRDPRPSWREPAEAASALPADNAAYPVKPTATSEKSAIHTFIGHFRSSESPV